MTEIIYDKEMPDAVRQEIEPILSNWKWLIPQWVQKLRVVWVPRSTDYETADIECSYEYRWVVLRVKGEWLDDKESQIFSIVHELVHTFSNVMADYARQELKRLLPEGEAPKYRGAVVDELTRRNEAFVQDLAWCLCQRFKAECNGNRT